MFLGRTILLTLILGLAVHGQAHAQKKALDDIVEALCRNQKKLINQLEKSRPEIILFKSEIDPWNSDFLQRVPMLVGYINKNYSFYSKFKFWTFVKINQ